MDAGFSNSCFTSRSDSAASSGSTTKTSISPHHRSGFSSLQGSTQGLDNIRAPPSKLTLSKLSTRTRERADESNKGTNKSDDDTKCARCSSKFFINLKLPCGRVVFLCPNCTADFRVHLGQKISEVLLRPFCAPHMQHHKSVSVHTRRNKAAKTALDGNGAVSHRWNKSCTQAKETEEEESP